MGQFKWKELGYDYSLKGISDATDEYVEKTSS